MAALYPEARVVAWLAVIAGSLATSHVPILFAGWGLLIALLAFCGQFRRHLLVVITVLVPLAAGLLLVWGFFVGAPPGLPRGSAPELGVLHAIRVVARLGIAAAVSQAAFLTIAPDTLWAAARRLGLRGTALSVVLSSFALAAGMPRIVDQTLTALKARGAIKPRQPLSRISVLPAMISNVWNRLVADQMQRVEYKWAPQRTLDRIEKIRVQIDWSKRWSMVVLIGSAFWLALALWSSFNG